MGSIVADKRVSVGPHYRSSLETGQGEKILFSPLSLIKSATDSFYGYIIFHDEYIFFLSNPYRSCVFC